MQVCEILDLLIDRGFQTVEIYDLNSEKSVFKGRGDEVPDDYEYTEVLSMDNIEKGTDVLTLNIESEEE